MSNRMCHRKWEPFVNSGPVGSSTVIEIGDALWWYATDHQIYPTSSTNLWNISEAQTQIDLKGVFLGIARQASAAGETAPVSYWTGGIHYLQLDSALNCEPGTMLTLEKDTGGNYLLDQGWQEAAAKTSAIAVCTEYGASLTYVHAYICSILGPQKVCVYA